MQVEALTGFRGGLAARRAPLDFGEEQWARLHGFVIEDGAVLRSQWPLQKIEGISDVSSFNLFQGPGEVPFLIVIKADGTVWWRTAPPDSAPTGSSDLDQTWRRVVDESGTDLTVAVGARPLVTVPIEAQKLSFADGGLQPCLIINTITMNDDQLVHFVYEDTDPTSESLRLRAMTLGRDTKWPVDADTDSAPKGEHATLWNGVLIYGDIEWKADPDQALAETNKTRYRNGLWLSEPGEPLLFDPLNVLFIGEPNTRVTGLIPTEQGLLVFLNSQEGTGGVWILRGTPAAYTLEPLHVGIGVTEGVANWTDTNTYAWVTAAGEVWQSDTEQMRRLDQQGLGTDRQNTVQEGVQSYGPWLLAMRERRLYCLRALSQNRAAAWTELQVDTLTDVPDFRFAHTVGQSIYFPAGGELFRFTRADMRDGVSRRGEVLGTLVDLAVGSRTLSTGEGHEKTYWHRVGLRATAGRRAENASVEKMVLRAGPVLDVDVPSLERVGPWTLSEAVTLEQQSTSGAVEFTETWTAADNATSIDADHVWTILVGAWELLTNQAVSNDAGTSEAFMAEQLSSNDQYAKVSLESFGTGTEGHVFVRNPGDGTSRTHYKFKQSATTATLVRVSQGTETVLATAANAVTLPVTIEIRAEGAKIVALVDGTEVLSVTDSEITVGRYAGIGAEGDGVTFDNFESGERVPESYVLWTEGGNSTKVTWGGGTQVQWNIAPAGTLPVPTHSPKRWQAIVRGVGATNEFSVEAFFRGDVQVEQITLFYEGGILGGTDEGR